MREGFANLITCGGGWLLGAGGVDVVVACSVVALFGSASRQARIKWCNRVSALIFTWLKGGGLKVSGHGTRGIKPGRACHHRITGQRALYLATHHAGVFVHAAAT